MVTTKFLPGWFCPCAWVAWALLAVPVYCLILPALTLVLDFSSFNPERFLTLMFTESGPSSGGAILFLPALQRTHKRSQPQYRKSDHLQKHVVKATRQLAATSVLIQTLYSHRVIKYPPPPSRTACRACADKVKSSETGTAKDGDPICLWITGGKASHALPLQVTLGPLWLSMLSTGTRSLLRNNKLGM